ncbi:MAG: ATP-dependent DNA ligase [Euryarchaeota archaeon]|nr:ATP-dependent DNA ligase [Euryarchaeota archaeon]
MEYGLLAETYARAEATAKRLELADLVKGLLEETPVDLVRPVIYLSQGRIAPDFQGIELGLSEKLTIGAIAGVAGVQEKEVVTKRNELGDLGSAAERLLSKKSQATLFRSPLTVESVFAKLQDIARTAGTGSQDKKLKILRLMLSESEPYEAKYLVRTVMGKLRLGIQDATVLDALAAMITYGKVETVTEMDEETRRRREEAKAALEYANDVSSDLGLVAETALKAIKEAERRLSGETEEALTGKALEAVKQIRLTVGVPLRAMLAERLSSAEEIVDKLGGKAALEYKYDGLRIQAHLDDKGTVKLFSRRLEDLTPQFPDVAEALRGAFEGKEAVVEGEAVAVDAESGRMLPFQAVSQRRGRKYGITERAEASQSQVFGVQEGVARRGAEKITEIPIATYLFDVLYLDGEELIRTPYEERRKRLAAAFDETARVKHARLEVVEDPAALESFMQDALAHGAEGIMAKSLSGVYKAGNREWQWIKYKADYVEGIADTLDLVVVGAFHGQGRRKGWYGAFLLASWNPDDARFETVCRVATGFDDQQLQELRERLEPKAIDVPPKDLFLKLVEKPDVWLEPELVMEVSGAEITLSPVHSCAWGMVRPDAGLAVRFPRFTDRLREDKGPTDTTTPDEIVALYQRQVKVTGQATAE